YGTHRSSVACTDRCYIRIDVLHGTINPHSVDHGTTGTINKHLNVSLRIGALQEQQLRLYHIGYVVVDWYTHKNNPVHHQSGEHVHSDDIHFPFLDNLRSKSMDIGHKGSQCFVEVS